MVLVVKNPFIGAVGAGGPGSIPGSGRSPEVGNGNPLQYSCLENSVDRGAWWATPWGHKEANMTTHTRAVLTNLFNISFTVF